MAKVFVTGGAGFIGSHIVEVLLQGGHQVEVIDDLSSGIRENVPEQVPLHELDICSPETARLLRLSAPDVLVHAAAQVSVRISMSDPVLDTRVNVSGLLNLLHAFSGQKLPFVVFASTGGAIYGEQHAFPATETHPIEPCSVYGLSKRVSEMYLDLWMRQYGLRYAALRFGNVYGPRQNPHGEAGVIAIFCEHLFRNKQVNINGSGEQTRDFVYVRDVAHAVRAVAERGETGTFNIGTGVETSINRIYGILSRITGGKQSPHHAPAKSGEQMRSCIDSSLAGRTFGWTPQVQIEQGLEITAQWFKESLIDRS
jgi:UDP-glucose 4-epimerase